jgi:hypothetical protein
MTIATRMMQTKRAKAGAEAEALRGVQTTTSSSRVSKTTPLGRERRRRRRVIRPKRSRLSPGKLTGEEGREAKNNTFKKVNGA